MSDSTLQFALNGSVPLPDAEATLRLAILTAECLHGEDRVHLEARLKVDRVRRTCLIDTATDVGRTLAAVFGGFIRREFGEESVRISRLKGTMASTTLETM